MVINIRSATIFMWTVAGRKNVVIPYLNSETVYVISVHTAKNFDFESQFFKSTFLVKENILNSLQVNTMRCCEYLKE